MVIAASGEDVVIHCPACGYAANLEKAQSIKSDVRRQEILPIEEVSTPGKKSIEEVATFLNIKKEQTLKAVFYISDGALIFVLIRGDLDVNEVKLKNALKSVDLRLATDEEVQQAGLVAGSASPVRLKGVRVLADDSITLGANFVSGANRPDYHLKNVNYPRDFGTDIILDIATARPGDACPKCSASLSSTRGIEVGHIFKLGRIFSEKVGAVFLDQKGEPQPIVMGCYGIGVGRLMAAAVEQSHDEKGIIWPVPLAPYQVHICALSGDNPDVASASEGLYHDLLESGVEVILDDRIASPGVKFNDADLIGAPLRTVLSPRSLKSQSAEMKKRSESSVTPLPLEGLPSRIVAEVHALQQSP